MIPDTSPTVENWMELGRFIGGSKSIECLQISLDGLDEVEDEIAIAGTENLEAFISSVANNRSLKDLWLDEYDFSRARLSILHPFVIENDNLVSLSLHSCNFGLHDLQMLAAAFSQRRNPTSMQVLCMSGSNITHESVPMIIDICCHCPRLQQLDLGYSSIGTRGLRILSTGLLANPECKLRHLSLAGIGGVDDNMAQLLANSLVSNNKTKRWA